MESVKSGVFQIAGLQLTKEQILTALLTIVVVAIILSATKKALKFVLAIAVIAGASIYFGLITPQSLQKVNDIVADASKVNDILAIVKDSDVIRTEFDGDTLKNIEVKIGDNWVGVDEITNMVEKVGDACVVTIGDKQYEITDQYSVKLLEYLSNGKLQSLMSTTSEGITEEDIDKVANELFNTSTLTEDLTDTDINQLLGIE